MKDLRQSPNWACFLKSLNWVVEEEGETKFFIKKLPPFGSAMKIQRPSPLPSLKILEKLSQKYRAKIIYLEPPASFSEKEGALWKKFGFEKYSSIFTYGKTVLLDISKSPQEIQKKFSQDTRYSLRKIEKSGLSVNFGDLSDFYPLFKETGKAKKFWVPSFSELEEKMGCFGKDAAFILIAKPPKEGPIAGAMFLLYDKTLYYHHAASNPEGRKWFAPYAVLWQGILEGKKRRTEVLNLEGIYDERFPRFSKRWQEFTVFKQKWGGEVLTYPPPLVKYNSLLLKTIFKITDLFLA